MSLDQQMTRYFDYMRPRYSNPTYKSSNVGVTLGTQYIPNQTIKTNYESMQPIKKESREESVRQINNLSYKIGKDENFNHKKRSNSHLSNYGSQSLSSLPKLVNERDIYEKQQKKYNIISIQPKITRQTIKKYPKFHLQNLDTNFYKKLQLQDEYKPHTQRQ